MHLQDNIVMLFDSVLPSKKPLESLDTCFHYIPEVTSIPYSLNSERPSIIRGQCSLAIDYLSIDFEWSVAENDYVDNRNYEQLNAK
jgi:hypothetical protein